ncbi:MAG: hypothetical protein AAF206_27190 [Bacteroidota bacterium]
MKKAFYLLVFSLFFLLTDFSLQAQQWSGSSGLNNYIWRNGYIFIPTTYPGAGYGFDDPLGGLTEIYEGTNWGDWGALNTGLSRGDINKINFTWRDTGNPPSNRYGSQASNAPLILQNRDGLGFKTTHGRMTMAANGIMTIGVLNNSKIESLAYQLPNVDDYKLYVGGGIRTEKVKVDLSFNWPDYVFEEDYELKELAELELEINTLGHLPGLPSAKKIETEGLELSEITVLQQEKIEELYLYVIELSRQLEELKAAHQALQEANQSPSKQ